VGLAIAKRSLGACGRQDDGVPEVSENEAEKGLALALVSQEQFLSPTGSVSPAVGTGNNPLYLREIRRGYCMKTV
jgi:hypothetical protein